MIKGIIFDFDGTLADSLWVWRKADKEFLEEYGYEDDNEFYQSVTAMTLAEAIEYIKKRYNIEGDSQYLQNKMHDMVYHKYADEVGMKDGAREYINYCVENNIKICIVTSAERNMCEAALTRNGLLNKFDGIYCVSEMNMSKSQPEIFDYAAKQMGIDKEHCLVFEDSLYAVKSAKKGGFAVIGVYDESCIDSEDEMISLCDGFVRGFDEAYGYLKVQA